MKIIWVILRNYKCYKATKVIYFWASWFCGMIWDNWVWKSSILEALQFFFYWDKNFFWINKLSKVSPSEAYVAPIIALDSADIVDGDHDIFLSIPGIIKEQLSAEWLNWVIALALDGTLQGKLLTILADWNPREIPSTWEVALWFIEKVRKHNNYVYIPAEFPIGYLTQIQSEVSESIVGKSLNSILEWKISQDVKTEINTTLNTYTTEKIIMPLQQINSQYNYKNLKWKWGRASLTQKVLAEMLIEVYFKDRWVYLGDISIEDLSSGQRRRAFIDYISALLFSSEEECKNLILAIDEPEISCDAVARYEQFERIIALQSKVGQILFTSHWYWWILQQKNGDLTLLTQDLDTSDRISKHYQTNEYPFKVDSEVPYDLRSYSDFLVSLWSLAQKFPEKRYIICEGLSDKNYLESSFQDDRYRFIIWWNREMVNKLFGFWKMQWRGFSQPANVRFVVDTDPSVEYEDKIYRIKKDQNLIYSITNDWISGWADEVADTEDLLEMQNFIISLAAVVTDDVTSTEADKEFVLGLQVKHPSLRWRASLWLSDVDKLRFKEIYNSRKKIVSELYSPWVNNSFLKWAIESIF